MNVTKASDQRPESYKLKTDGIRILSDLSTQKEWRARKDVVLPLQSHCLCCLVKQRDSDGYPTLGLIKPRTIDRLVITPGDAAWTDSQLAILRQGHLFAEPPSQELEKVPYNFRYEFRCDHSECSGHKLICTDWEMGEAWRKWTAEYGDQWEEKFRLRFEMEMIQKRDTHFFVGTVHQYPGTWIIVGLFYPPYPLKGPLAIRCATTMNELERWDLLVSLDDEFFIRGAILSEWCSFKTREANNRHAVMTCFVCQQFIRFRGDDLEGIHF